MQSYDRIRTTSLKSVLRFILISNLPIKLMCSIIVGKICCKSLSSIYLPPMDQSPEVNEGYMGHDEFSVVENRLVRRFPVYKAEDTNAQPTGGTRQLQYRLEAGEAGWILQLDRVVEFQ